MRNTILIIIGFVFYYLGFKQFEPIMLFIDQGIHYRLASYFFTYIIIGLPLFIITCIINKRLNFFYHLGLQPGIFYVVHRLAGRTMHLISIHLLIRKMFPGG